jgi:hypothetical protein
VQHHGEADAGAQVLGIGGNRQQGLGRGLEQNVVDHGLVLIGNIGDGHRQREHHVIVRHRQQFGLARSQLFLRCRTLALRAMPVTAGVIGNVRVRARLAARHMPAESRRATALDRRHDLQLAEAHRAGVGLAPRWSMVAEDLRDLQAGRDMRAAL